MKRIVTLVAFACCTAGLTGCVGGIEMLNFGRKTPAPTGRYQVTSANTSLNAMAVKIDTTTGESWFLLSNDPRWRKIAD